MCVRGAFPRAFQHVLTAALGDKRAGIVTPQVLGMESKIEQFPQGPTELKSWVQIKFSDSKYWASHETIDASNLIYNQRPFELEETRENGPAHHHLCSPNEQPGFISAHCAQCGLLSYLHTLTPVLPASLEGGWLY